MPRTAKSCGLAAWIGWSTWLKNSPAFTIINEVTQLVRLVNNLLQLSKGARTEATSYIKLARRQTAAPAGRRGGNRATGQLRSDLEFGAGKQAAPRLKKLGVSAESTTTRHHPPGVPKRGFISCSGLRATVGRLTAVPKVGTAFSVQAFHKSGWVKGDSRASELRALKRLYVGKAVVTKVATMNRIFTSGVGFMATKVTKAADGLVGPTASASQAPTSGDVVARGSSPVSGTVEAAPAVPVRDTKRSVMTSLSKRERMLVRSFWGVDPKDLDFHLVVRKTSLLRTRLTFDRIAKGKKGRLATYILKVAGYRQKDRLLPSAIAKSSEVIEGRTYASVAVQSECDDASEWTVIGRVRSASNGGTQVQEPDKTPEVDEMRGLKPGQRILKATPTTIGRFLTDRPGPERALRALIRDFTKRYEEGTKLDSLSQRKMRFQGVTCEFLRGLFDLFERHNLVG